MAMVSSSSLAHERPSFATSISSAGDQVAIQTTFGLILGPRDDFGPGEWRWICTTAMRTIPTEDPPTFFLNEATLLMPGFDGLTIGTNDACDWAPASPDLTNVQVFDGVASSHTENTGYAVTSGIGRSNAVYVTRDSGRTWASTGNALSGAARYDSVRLAPSDPQRIYVGASSIASLPGEPSQAVVYRSDDGGETWMSTVLTMQSAERGFQLMGVDPQDADHLLARFSSAFSDRVVQSFDGGQTFTDLIALASAEGFAWSDDGDTVFLSGSEEPGLYRSNDGAVTFERIRDDLALGCLSFVGDTLWACGGADPEIAVSRSLDDGASFEPVLRFADDLTFELPCGAETTVGQQCVDDLREIREDFGLPTDDPSADAGPAEVGRIDVGPVDAGRADVGSSETPDASSDAGVGGPPAAAQPESSGCQTSDRGAFDFGTLLLPLILLLTFSKGRPRDDIHSRSRT